MSIFPHRDIIKVMKLEPLEAGILTALKALENQIARELQRTPSETELQGVTKWEPYSKRVEKVTGFVLDLIESKSVDLDGIFVMAQAFSKALAMVATDVGPSDLGEVRSDHMRAAGQALDHDAQTILNAINTTQQLS